MHGKGLGRSVFSELAAFRHLHTLICQKLSAPSFGFLWRLHYTGMID